MCMKKLFTLIAAVLMTAVATADPNTSGKGNVKQVVWEEGLNWYSRSWDPQTQSYVGKKLEEPTVYDNYYYFYDSQNRKSVEKTYTTFRYVYNADGTVSAKETWNFMNGVYTKSVVLSYVYDDSNNLISETRQSYNAAGEKQGSATTTEYGAYVNGLYGVIKTAYEEIHYNYEFNEAQQLTKAVQLTGDDFTTPQQATFYTYENGQLLSEKTATYASNADAGHEWDNIISTTNYIYNVDGTLQSKYVISDANGSHSEVEWRYHYSDLNPSLVPQNIVCDAISLGNNEVYVKWDAVAGASDYVVICDNKETSTEGRTDFVTEVLNDGIHQIAVLAVVDGEKKNLSDFQVVSVKDEGNLPMENFEVLAAEKVEVDSYGWVSEYYNLTLSWKVPEGASEITDYKVYVDKQNGETWYPSTNYNLSLPESDKPEDYNAINSWVTNRNNFYWTTFEDSEYDEMTWETKSLGTGPDCKVWITAIYATGESQKSNVVEVNVYKLANGVNSVKAVKTVNDAPVEVYNLAGQRLTKAGPRQVYVVRQGNNVRKVLK